MERFKIGQYVFTTKDKGSTDWQDNERARRRPWGAFGVVDKIHNSHGLVYAVKIYAPKPERIEYYEHEELEAAG